MHRLFVALRPPALQRAELIDMMTGIQGARWQDDDQLHLTLRFIGEVNRPQAHDIADRLRQVRFSPFEIALNGLGIFDRRGRIDSLWAAAEPREPLERLHQKVERACTSAGLSPESRACLPHVTLARFGREAVGVDTFLARHAGLKVEPFTATWFGLFESELGRSGATYHLLERYDASPSCRSQPPPTPR